MLQDVLCPIEKMRLAGLSTASVAAFERAFEQLSSGINTEIPESAIEPPKRIDDYLNLPNPEEREVTKSLEKTVVIKLNGGLGTGMGLEGVKSLLEVRDGMTFLDIIVRQVLSIRASRCQDLRFLLMNSFSTSEETKAFLLRYPDLGEPDQVELVQNRIPKIDAHTLGAVKFPDSLDLEWCPPGHGDLYPALLGTGWLDRLLDEGVRYAFVSNADNLGATLDIKLLNGFVRSGAPFLMEVTARTESDKKGGHLALDKETESLIIRESAQCPAEDAASFQDINRYCFFNTNNLWIRLAALKKYMAACGGVMPLPVMMNRKTVNPRDQTSDPVIQLEVAMGGAIQCFEGSNVVAVPRWRFAPVKSSENLFALRSDAYTMTEGCCLQLAPERNGIPPFVRLDKKYYKREDQLSRATSSGVPSLKGCERIEVTGSVEFAPNTTFLGCVNIKNQEDEMVILPPGIYENEVVILP